MENKIFLENGRSLVGIRSTVALFLFYKSGLIFFFSFSFPIFFRPRPVLSCPLLLFLICFCFQVAPFVRSILCFFFLSLGSVSFLFTWVRLSCDRGWVPWRAVNVRK